MESIKHLQISKANARIVAIIALAAFLTTFSLLASRALLNQRSYHARVISEKSQASARLKDNLEAVQSLQSSYGQFIAGSPNLIGGDPKGTGDRDGDNAKIILDALPSKYDFPALTSSIEKLLVERNFKPENITGTDDELGQTASSTSPNPAPVEIPFQVTLTSNYTALNSLIQVFERSIRPIHITAVTYTGNDSATQLVISAKTYYQPSKSLDITTKVVK